MKGIASRFTEEALEELKKQLDIVLDDDHDYSEDELSDLYDRITDDFPYAYANDEFGTPLRMGQIFDDIVDVFIELGVS